MFQQALLEINNRLEKISGLVLANLNSGEGITAEDGARVGLNGCEWDKIGCESKKILFR